MRWRFILALHIILAAIGAACSDPEPTPAVGLPHYAHKGPDGAVRIDLSEASAGSAQLAEAPPGIVFRSGDFNTRLRFTAWSPSGGIGNVLAEPPLRISPRLGPVHTRWEDRR